MKIKSLLVIAVLATVFLGFGFNAQVQTDVSAMIAQLQAQIASLMAQLQTLQAQQGTAQTWCYTFNTNLGVGNVVNDDTVNLNVALGKSGFTPLHSDMYSEDMAAEVVQFQVKYGITPQSGYVGPKTRAKLNSLYGCGITPPPITSCTPNWTCSWGSCVNGWQQKTAIDSNNCGVYSANAIANCTDLSKQACTPSTNLSPVISGVSGPTTLSVGQVGTWTINANDPENGTLSYSVIWGDNTPTPMAVGESGIPANSAFTQQASFTHSFSRAGNFYVQMFVRDNAGNKASSSVSVNVGNSQPNQPSITVTSPNGGETFVQGQTYNITWRAQNFGNLNVSLDLVQYNDAGQQSVLTNIANNIPNTGFYAWTVPSNTNGMPMPKVKILAGSFDRGPSAQDLSDNYFSIVSPSANNFDVLSSIKSSGGDMIFSFSRIASACLQIKNSRGEYFRLNTTNPLVSCGGTLMSGYSLQLSVPKSYFTQQFVVGDYYQVCTYDTTGNNACSSPVRVEEVTTQPSITTTSPNGGETWASGDIKNISWASSGLLSTDRIDISLYHYDSNGYKDGQAMLTATAGTTTFYPWVINPIAGVSSNGNYKILLQVYRDTVHNIVLTMDMSNNYFTVSAATTSPTTMTPAEIRQSLVEVIADHATNFLTPASRVDQDFNLDDSQFIDGTDMAIMRDIATVSDAQFQKVFNKITHAVTSRFGVTAGADYVAGLDTNSDYVINATDLSNIQNALQIIRPATPVITVTSPYNNVTWTKGSTHNITWVATGMDNVTLRVQNITTGLSTIISFSTPAAQESYSWTVPSTLVDANTYELIISDRDNPTYTPSVASFPFTIADANGKSVTITSPVGGETWTKGSTHNITWVATGMDNVTLRVQNITTGLSTIISFKTPASQGTYSWTIPSTLVVAGTYEIVITNWENTTYSGNTSYSPSAETPIFSIDR